MTQNCKNDNNLLFLIIFNLHDIVEGAFYSISIANGVAKTYQILFLNDKS